MEKQKKNPNHCDDLPKDIGEKYYEFDTATNTWVEKSRFWSAVKLFLGARPADIPTSNTCLEDEKQSQVKQQDADTGYLNKIKKRIPPLPSWSRKARAVSLINDTKNAAITTNYPSDNQPSLLPPNIDRNNSREDNKSDTNRSLTINQFKELSSLLLDCVLDSNKITSITSVEEYSKNVQECSLSVFKNNPHLLVYKPVGKENDPKYKHLQAMETCVPGVASVILDEEQNQIVSICNEEGEIQRLSNPINIKFQKQMLGKYITSDVDETKYDDMDQYRNVPLLATPVIVKTNNGTQGTIPSLVAANPQAAAQLESRVNQSQFAPSYVEESLKQRVYEARPMQYTNGVDKNSLDTRVALYTNNDTVVPIGTNRSNNVVLRKRR